MGDEVEVKVRVADAGAVRARLMALGATPGPRMAEVNRLFDWSDGRLRRDDCGLRLREERPLAGEGQRARLTWKGPRQRGPGGVKSREELECDVGEGATLAGILSRLGLAETVRYDKRREAWQLAGCEVVLDELPRLGWFVEIEGPDAAAVQALQERLGLPAADAVGESYPELAERHGGRLVF